LNTIQRKKRSFHSSSDFRTLTKKISFQDKYWRTRKSWGKNKKSILYCKTLHIISRYHHAILRSIIFNFSFFFLGLVWFVCFWFVVFLLSELKKRIRRIGSLPTRALLYIVLLAIGVISLHYYFHVRRANFSFGFVLLLLFC
jgi:hypothetical protein